MDYIVIRYFSRFVLTLPGIPDAWAEWAKVWVVDTISGQTLGKRVCAKRISRTEARRLIDERGLTESLRTEDGVVFDTPDQKFKQMYGGVSRVPSGLPIG